MTLHNPSAFSAFKNISSLLPSVQNKMTHNALIKLLLDQGRDIHKQHDIVFENTLLVWEKIFRQKQIPFETLYRTTAKAVAPQTDSWTFSYPDGQQIECRPDHAFCLYLVRALLGQSDINSISDTPLSTLEKQILKPFFELLVEQLPQIHHQRAIQTTYQQLSETNTQSVCFALKTPARLFELRLILSTPIDAQTEADWQSKLQRHITALNLPVTGTLQHQMTLADFLSLKKGDRLTFSSPLTDAAVAVQTHGQSLFQGRLLKTDTNQPLQIEPEDK